MCLTMRSPTQRCAGVVMAHGMGAVKEMFLDRFGEAFAAAGLVTLVFDYRHYGASGGEPRQLLMPFLQHEDYRNAITWLGRHPLVDPERIGAWGTSFSGGHVLHLAAFDRRIKAAVAQVPAVDLWANAERVADPVRLAGFAEALAAARSIATRTRNRRCSPSRRRPGNWPSSPTTKHTSGW